MIKSRFLNFLCIALLSCSSLSCALAVTEELLGDDVATHDDDQMEFNGGNQGNFQ